MEWLFLGAIALAIWMVRTAWKNRSAARDLAARAGFSPLNPFDGRQQDWFSSVVHGRRVAIGMVALRTPYQHWFQQPVQHLRVVMDVVMWEPLEVLALRRHHDTSSLHRFEEAFRVERGEKLGKDAREALLTFVRRGYPERTGRWKRQHGPNARNLRFVKRAALPEASMPASLMPDSRMVLIHDHPRLHLSADQFGELLHEMSQVAAALEDTRFDSAPTTLP